MAQMQVITGVERRRRWDDDQKRTIVAAAFAPGAVVTDVARRADVCSSLIYRWRRELRDLPTGFARVVLATPAPDQPDAREAAIEVALGDDLRLRIPPSIPPELASAVVAALVRRPVCRSPGEGR
jgi:transposase